MFASLILRWFIHLCQFKAVDSFHTPLLSCRQPSEKDCRNQIRIKRSNRGVFVCSSFFLTVRLQRSSDWNLRSASLIISDVVALQTSVWCRNTILWLKAKWILITIYQLLFVCHYTTGRPHYLKQPNYSWPLESSSGFSHLWSGVFHIPLLIHKTQPRGWKKRKNKHRLGLASSARGGSLSYFWCILWANASVYSSENTRKATSNADLSPPAAPPGIWRSTGPSSRLPDFCWLVSPLPDWPVLSTGLSSARLTCSVDWSPLSWLTCSVDWSLLLPSTDCVLVLTSADWSLLLPSADCSLGPSFLRPLPVSWEITRVGPLCGFRAKTDKDILWQVLIHTHKTNAQHRITFKQNENRTIIKEWCAIDVRLKFFS